MISGTILLILRLAILLSLYSFVAWALYILWRDFRCQVREVSEPQAPPIRIKLISEDSAGAEFWNAEVFIGRDPACEFPIDDPTISARHARLSYHHGHWWVEDLQSTNGTLLNQDRVQEPLVITNGDQLRCGQIMLEVEVGRIED